MAGAVDGSPSGHKPDTGLLEGATELPPPNVQSSTPGEFAARWNAEPDAMRQAWLDGLRGAFEAQERCLLREQHDARLELAGRTAHDAEEALRPLLGALHDAEAFVIERMGGEDYAWALDLEAQAAHAALDRALELLGVRR